MKEKIKILHYKCMECNYNKDFLSNESINAKCKVCGNEMIFDYSKNYNPNNGLKAIKNSRMKNNNNTEFIKKNNLMIECPYFHAINVRKITITNKAVHTAMFGIFSIGRNAKQWHCNNCGYEW